MTSARLAAAPPALDGYRHLDLVGSGGFADVFRYRELATARQVAVKVLARERISAAARRRFEEAARLISHLSSHPSIVTVLRADIAPDGRRPYLVTEYCPFGDLGAWAHSSQFGVPEALRIGVEIAGAVETAHRSGILHHDIKPANILYTEYRRPVLADFGIARLRGSNHKESALSVPWAPPEFFTTPRRSDERSDVWGLAATIYTLLEGRSPFEVAGADNSPSALRRRIVHANPNPISRLDVPAPLLDVLAIGLSKPREARYRTALEFGQALQAVQSRLGLPVTAIEIPPGVTPATRRPSTSEHRHARMHGRRRASGLWLPRLPSQPGWP